MRRQLRVSDAPTRMSCSPRNIVKCSRATFRRRRLNFNSVDRRQQRRRHRKRDLCDRKTEMKKKTKNTGSFDNPSVALAAEGPSLFCAYTRYCNNDRNFTTSGDGRLLLLLFIFFSLVLSLSPLRLRVCIPARRAAYFPCIGRQISDRTDSLEPVTIHGNIKIISYYKGIRVVQGRPVCGVPVRQRRRRITCNFRSPNVVLRVRAGVVGPTCRKIIMNSPDRVFCVRVCVSTYLCTFV